MTEATKRSIVRWIHIFFAIPIYLTIFIVRLKKFRTTLRLPGLCSFLSWSFRGFGCGKAMSFDDLFRRDRPNKMLRIVPSRLVFGPSRRFL